MFQVPSFPLQAFWWVPATETSSHLLRLDSSLVYWHYRSIYTLGNAVYVLLCWPDDLWQFSQSFFKASPGANHFFKQILIGQANKWACFVSAMEETILKTIISSTKVFAFYDVGNGLFGNKWWAWATKQYYAINQFVPQAWNCSLYSLKPAQILYRSQHLKTKKSWEMSSYGQSNLLKIWL